MTVETVRLAVEQAKTKKLEPNGVELLCAADIAPEPIDWIWKGWLAARKLCILAGPAGTGKTTIALEMAATITTAGVWPDGTTADYGSVLMWSGEDGIGDSLVPRLHACRADRARVHFVGGVQDQDGKRAFDPSTDMEMLIAAIRRIKDLRLIIIDPIVSAVAGDSHKNAEVRRGLQPVVDLANEIGCAVLGITHFTKGTQGRDPTERVTGSLAFGALARLVLCTAKPTEEDSKRRLVRAKSNIGPGGDGFEYDLAQRRLPDYPDIEAQYILWGEPLTGTARDLLEEVEKEQSDDGEGVAVENAKAFLLNLLKGAPVASKDIRQNATEAGISWIAVRRAKDALGVAATKTGLKGGWVWSLSSKSEGAHQGTKMLTQNCVSIFGDGEHLRVISPSRDPREDGL
jgi:RecA-family ATPase